MAYHRFKGVARNLCENIIIIKSSQRMRRKSHQAAARRRRRYSPSNVGGAKIGMVASSLARARRPHLVIIMRSSRYAIQPGIIRLYGMPSGFRRSPCRGILLGKRFSVGAWRNNHAAAHHVLLCALMKWGKHGSCACFRWARRRHRIMTKEIVMPQRSSARVMAVGQ